MQCVIVPLSLFNLLPAGTEHQRGTCSHAHSEGIQSVSVKTRVIARPGGTPRVRQAAEPWIPDRQGGGLRRSPLSSINHQTGSRFQMCSVVNAHLASHLQRKQDPG